MLKILHIASFQGNIGDNASHLGFLSILKAIKVEAEIKTLEIRKAYRNYNLADKLVFDASFAELANTFDCIIFGGGGFLDYWVEGSINGTTLDIDNNIFDLIKKPILISSIGSNPHRKVPVENYKKFESFLNFVKSNESIQIALRNDGSSESITKDFGDDLASIFHQILDHGFFYNPISTSNSLSIEKEYAAINITNDQLEMYNEGRKSIDKKSYFKELEKLVTFIIEEKKLKVVFVPHIYSDVIAISEFIQTLPDHFMRSEIIIAPCYQSDKATDFNFNIYKNSNLVIASRYHANVCSMKFGKQTIGLSPLRRIKHIHNQFMPEDTSFFIEENFSEKVINSINKRHLPDLDKLNNEKQKTINFYSHFFKDLERNKSITVNIN